jgi:RND family efflux transporter MFP subunit
MSEERSTIGGISPRRLAAVVGMVVLLVLSILGVAFYHQLGGLLRPSLQRPAAVDMAETQDVRVQRGPITKVLRLAGTVQPKRQAELAFDVVQAEVVDVPVAIGQQVWTGDTLVQLDVAALGRTLAKARNELLEARRSWQDLIEEGGLRKRIQLQEELRQANAALDEAQRELQSYLAGKGTLQQQREQAQGQLASARWDLEALRDSEARQQQIDQLQVISNEAEVKHGPYVLIENPSEQDRDMEWLLRNIMLDRREALDQARLQYEMDIRAAQHAVALAERTLRDLNRQIDAGSPEVELLERQAAVRKGEADVGQILAQLDALDQGAPDADLAKAQAEVVKLEGRVADAEAALAEATLTAPFDGVVEEIKTQPGTVVSPGIDVVTLFDASAFYVLARVNDIDVAQLKAGEDVQLTFDAFPGQALPGTSGEIPAFGTYENGLTVFDVPVNFDAQGLPLRLGMSANVNVSLFRKEDVLIIPAMAVQRDEEGSFVIVVEGRQTERRRVELGISDGLNVEVVRGLEKGEVVRMLLQGPVGPW